MSRTSSVVASSCGPASSVRGYLAVANRIRHTVSPRNCPLSAARLRLTCPLPHLPSASPALCLMPPRAPYTVTSSSTHPEWLPSSSCPKPSCAHSRCFISSREGGGRLQSHSRGTGRGVRSTSSRTYSSPSVLSQVFYHKLRGFGHTVATQNPAQAVKSLLFSRGVIQGYDGP